LSHYRALYYWFNWIEGRSSKSRAIIIISFHWNYSARKCNHNTPILCNWVPWLNHKRVCGLLSYNSVRGRDTCIHYYSFQALVCETSVHSIDNISVSINFYGERGSRFGWIRCFYQHKADIAGFPCLIICDKKGGFPKSDSVLSSIVKGEAIPSTI